MGATPQVIENLLANFLTRYRRRHPDVEVHLIEDGGVRLNSRLERGDVHLVLTAANGRIDNRLLYPMHALAALSPTHPRARQAVLEVADLADEPLLLLRRDFGSREWFDAACSVAHIRHRVLLESAARHTLIALAATGDGIAIIPSNAQEPRGAVRAMPLIYRGASVGRWAMIMRATALPPSNGPGSEILCDWRFVPSPEVWPPALRSASHLHWQTAGACGPCVAASSG